MNIIFDMTLVHFVIVNLLKLVFLYSKGRILCSVWEIPGCPLLYMLHIKYSISNICKKLTLYSNVSLAKRANCLHIYSCLCMCMCVCMYVVYTLWKYPDMLCKIVVDIPALS